MSTTEEIVFPVYPFPIYYTTWEEGTETWMKSDTSDKEYLLDDKGLPGDLAKRRLALVVKGVDIYKLKRTIKDENSLYLNSKMWGTHKFIDSAGKIFKMKKAGTVVKLTYHKIKGQKIVEGSHTILFLEGINKPFTWPRPIHEDGYWAGVLWSGKGMILKEILPEEPARKVSWRIK